MNLANTISIYCDAGVRATLPSGSQINPEHTQWNRAKHQKGPDKGGTVTAGGPGSGCRGENCGRRGDARSASTRKMLKNWDDNEKEAKRASVIKQEREKIEGLVRDGKISRGAADTWIKHLGGSHVTGKTKTLKSEAAGGQSESFNVTDYMDRTLHRFKTRDEAERASAGNRYTRVKTQRPAEKVFDLSPVIKKTDKKIAPGRRTEGYQNPFPSNPSGR